MSSPSKPVTLTDLADRLTERNHGSHPTVPPPVAVASPIHEILVREIAESLPAELRARLEAEPSVERVMDWLAAGAIFRWVRADPLVARAFLEQVAKDPARAGWHLAQALAARMEPPPREAAWHACDRWGLMLQALFLLGVLAGRAVLFGVLGWLQGLWTFASWEALLLAPLGWGVVFGTPSGSLVQIVAAGLGGAWLVWEAFWAPLIMERIRQAPAQRQKLAPPLSWRVDTFYSVWIVQALFFGAMLIVKLSRVAFFGGEDLGLRISSTAVCIALVAFAWCAVQRGGAQLMLKLGTQPVKEKGP